MRERMRKLWKMLKVGCLIVMVLSMSVYLPALASSKQTLSEKFNIQKRNVNAGIMEMLSSTKNYADMLDEYKKKNLLPSGGEVILFPEQAVRTDGNSASLSEGYESYDGTAVVWDDKANGYEWSFDVAEEGLYEISVEYFPVRGDNSSIQRRLYIDGAVPFEEAENIKLPRLWKESGKPFFDINGDEKAPTLVQEYKWSHAELRDLHGMYSSPLHFYFKHGKHTLKLEYVDGEIALGRVALRTPERLPAYSEVKTQYSAEGYVDYKGQPVKKQGEDAAYRTERILKRIYNTDLSVEPKAMGNVRQNAIGGWYWIHGNDAVTWDIDVPEDGLYKIASRVLQNYNNGLPIYRQVLVDGKVPYQELDAYRFKFDTQWRTEVLGGSEPYLIRLEKGKHEITMRAVSGGVASVIEELTKINLSLSKVIRDVMTITGPQPDLNFQYELDKKIPWVMDELKSIRDGLNREVKQLVNLSGKRPPMANSIASAAEDVDNLIKYPELIPARLNDLANLQTNISLWYMTLQDMPLTVDYIELLAPDDKIQNVYSTFWENVKLTWLNFLRSFTKNYEGISVDNKNAGKASPRKIDVWIARGREWGELLQILADEDFTPKTGINVNVNILPSGSVGVINGVSPLMLSLITGDSPDVALGSDSNTPVELAIRGAAQDLSKFEDFEEVKERFLPDAVVPFEYKNGVFALPETMDFPIMLYRTDITNLLGIEVPQTWHELYSKVLPVLKQNGCDLYMPPTLKQSGSELSSYTTFLFQNDGDFYTPDGLKSRLDSDAAYKAFLQWTKNYTVYRMSSNADLFSHFRVGDIPIAIGSLNDYLKLRVAAPELYGRWSIAPIPGTLKENGEIDRSVGGLLTSTLMFSQSKEKDAGWEFIKWWTSADTQERFSSEIESLVGPEARWFSANTEAFRSLPWDKDDLKVITDGWKWFRNPPNVLGGYITFRHLNNAWTRTVLNNMKPRDSLEQAVKDIKKELERKQEEYGVKSK